MRFEWDELKNRSNKSKHGISFELATQAFLDPNQLVFEDFYEEEQRLQLVGAITGARLLLVIHTYRQADGEIVIRIISARKATPQERRRYEEIER